jgi:heptosyltransferase III
VRILILKFRNIGDVLLITPLLSNLKQYYPKAQIDVVINKGTELMVSLNPNINKLFIYDRNLIKSLSPIKKLWNEFQFSFSFRKNHYDMAINLTEGDRGAQIAWLSGAPIRIGYPNKNLVLKNAFTHFLPRQGLRHTLETNLDPLRALDIPITSKNIEVFWSKKDEKIVKDRLSTAHSFIHIHPVSRWLFKCLADRTMAKIIDYCETELETKVVITAAPEKDEINKVNSILSLCRSDPINLSGKLTLKQTVALNKKAKIFIGVDTAIMHISAANNIPVFAFFGPSGANHWGPWDNDLMESGYTKINGFQTMGMHTVFSEGRECQPCGQDGCDGTKVSDCLMHLDIDIIKKNIQGMLND